MREPADDAADQRGSDSADASRSGLRGSRIGGSGFRHSRQHDAAGSPARHRGASSPGRAGPAGTSPSGNSPSGNSPRTGSSGGGNSGSGNSGGGNSGSWPVADGGGGSSVFAPGYDTGRAPGDLGSAGPGGTGAPWYGSAAGGATGKGPVRGYPPTPGQPPPMYPPGQFAAWNRGRHGSQIDGPDRGYPGSPGPDGAQPAASGQQTSWQSAAGTARYYGRDDEADVEPGYSTLAVSDPAADVTSTQTWQAVGDGRATGIWTAPARPGGEPGSPGVPGDAGLSGRSGLPGRLAPGGVAAPQAWPGSEPGEPAGRRASSGRHSMRPSVSGQQAVLAPDRAGQPGGAGAGAVAAAGAATTADPASRRPAGTGPAGPAGSALQGASDHFPRGRGSRHGGGASDSSRDRHSGRDRSGSPDGSGAASTTLPRAQPGSGRRGSGSRTRRPASVKLAIGVAVLLVAAAAGTLAYTVLHRAPKPKPAAGQVKQTPAASASPSPSLGPYGHIASRSADPQPLTIAQLFPANFAVGGQSSTLTASKLGTNCTSALVGSSLRTIVGEAHCSQVARATYLSSSQRLMGTIGVLNLGTAAGATKAARKASASDFISQLKAKHGPTRNLGRGTGIEQAAAKGHYLILIWAEFTSRHKPRTNAQRTQIENFMTELLRNTANRSLTTRMLTGTP